METIPPAFEDWEVTGDVPGDAGLLYGPAAEHFDGRKGTMEASLKPDHEIATKIGGDIVPAGTLSFEPQADGRTYIVRWAGEHKKQIVVGLTVGGVLLAVNQLRVRRKK